MTATLLSWGRGTMAQSSPASSGVAELPPWTLDWQAPPECPDATWVRAHVTRLLAAPSPPARSTRDASLSVRATIERRRDRWSVELATHHGGIDPIGERRTLEDPQCAALSEATAWVIAMALDPELSARMLGPALDPTLDTSTSSSEAPPVETRVDDRTAATSSLLASTSDERASRPSDARAPAVWSLRTQRTERRQRSSSESHSTPVRWSVGLGAALDSGITPSIALAPHTWGALRWRTLRLEWSLAYWFGRQASAAQRPSAIVTVDAFSTQALGCYARGWSAFELGACASVEAAVVRGRSQGVTDPGRAVTPWVATGAHGLLALSPTRWLSFVATVGGVVALARPAFFIEPIGTIVESPLFAARGRLGLEVRF